MTANRTRFGIGEWYGELLTEIDVKKRRSLAERQLVPRAERDVPVCPFLSGFGEIRPCWKESGIYTLQRYELDRETSAVTIASENAGLRTTCPSRFEEGGLIYGWIGEVLLNDPQAVPIGQVNFLQRMPLMGDTTDAVSIGELVGRIDNVVVPDSNPLQWCAVEIQAVYFSGASMTRDFRALLTANDQLPFPAGHRRPDYRSSGPKRLMPQLQIKVPTLRRWGKRTAVVVDEHFFGALGRMQHVHDISNADVAWFVVRYDDRHRLARGSVYLTTLEESVEGLVAARPVTLAEFEDRITRKYRRSAPSPSQIFAD